MASEGSSWWELYTLESSDISKTTRLPFSSASSVCGTVGRWEPRHRCSVEATGFGGGWEHDNCASSQMIAKKRECVAVMSVGFPGVVLWHIVCPNLCCALPEGSHLTCLWPGVINRHFGLWSQESDCRSSAFSEVLTFVVLATPCTLTHRPLCSPSSLVLHRKGFSLVHPFHTGTQRRCYQSLVLCGQMLRRSMNVFCSVSSCLGAR